MDGDFCAVCADTLEWVAYGPCGHKDVCSTCVARLRFICDDSYCCICKTKSDVVFVTKALGDYTHTINDFSTFNPHPKEGRVGSYWYHEDTQAFFDDVDHYKMVKAMCKLSCSICDQQAQELPADGSKRKPNKFRNIEQLKGHMFHQHKLVMCNLCLNGRKIFICEQKLYTKAQLKQHINTGDSEVDGTENERGGFSGHPKCEFCRTPFYGDNELFSHMSTEHYTCHICQRQHPGQYDYFQDYDDLEMHFRREHFLCDDHTCLAKKFIVFQSETQLKRHNAMEHAGRMSKSEHRAALTLPTSFRYRRENEQERNRGRRSFQRDTSQNQLSDAIQACIDSSSSDGVTFPDVPSSSRSTAPVSVEMSEDDPLVTPFESQDTTEAELAARYRQAVSLPRLAESAFPPLPVVPPSSQVQPLQDPNSMAARLRRLNRVNVVTSSTGTVARRPPPLRPVPPQPTSGQMRLTANSVQTPSSFSNPVRDKSSNSWPTLNASSASQNGAAASLASQNGPAASSGPSRPASLNVQSSGPSRPASLSVQSSGLSRPASHSEQSSGPSQPASHNVTTPSIQDKPSNAWPTLNGSSSKPAASSAPIYPASQNGAVASSYSTSLLVRPQARVTHSTSAPNLGNKGSFEATDFPPVSATTQVHKPRPVSQVAAPPVDDRQAANATLAEQIRAALDFDQDKFSAFKDISSEYRVGTIDAETYLYYVEQFGLSHLVFELARLLPDAQKQRELFEAYKVNMVDKGTRENGTSVSSKKSSKGKDSKDQLADSILSSGSSKKGKEKVDPKDQLADSILSSVRQLQSSYKATENETEVLSKDGYRTSKGKPKVVADQPEMPLAEKSMNDKNQSDLVTAGGSNQKVGEKTGKNKKNKKTSKFLRARLGDGSAAAVLDVGNSNSDPEPDPDAKDAPAEGGGLPAHGVWRAGGAKNLFPSSKK